MKILIINPNSSEEITSAIRKSLNDYIEKGDKVEVISTQGAPVTIESYFDEAITTTQLINIVQEKEQDYDGFVIACHSDPGLYAIREITDKPVVGIGEASIIFSLLLGHKFSVVSVKEKAVPKKEDLIRKYGLMERCASVRATGLGVGDIEKDPERAMNLMEITGKKCIKEDGAEVLVLGCAGMAGFDKKLEKRLGVPVIDGVVCAYFLIRNLISYKVGTSKIRKFKLGRKYKKVG